MFFNYSAAVFFAPVVGVMAPTGGAGPRFHDSDIGVVGAAPADRRPPPGAALEKRLTAWAVPIVVIVLMLIIASLTLPKPPASGEHASQPLAVGRGELSGRPGFSL